MADKKVWIKKKPTEEKTYHECDFCDEEFVCPQGKMEYCDCLQAIVKGGLTPAQEKAGLTGRLAFWCSDSCWDHDFPQDTSDDDGNDDEDFEDLTYGLLKQTHFD